MDKKLIMLTGGHSYLGQKFISHLLNSGDAHIKALITPWAESEGLVQEPERLQYLTADLTEELSDEVKKDLREADYAVHFAWKRGTSFSEVLEANQKMVANILSHLREPKRFIFISTVAASPETLSLYGKTKFLVAQRVLGDGGLVVAAGLIVDDEPQGPYKLLVNVAKSMPVGVRATPGAVKLYPVKADDFVAGLKHLLDSEPQTGSYRLFPERAVDLNDFLSRLETKHGRKRLRIRFSYGLALSALKTLRSLHVPPKPLQEKLITFLYKDEKYLSAHKKIEGFERLERPLSELV